jgi:hypothetical protein
LSQITGDDALGIAARMVEQGMAAIRAEAGTAVARITAERDAAQAEVERLAEERGALLERVEELEDAASDHGQAINVYNHFPTLAPLPVPDGALDQPDGATA